MKNVKFNKQKTDKNEKYKEPIKKLDSFNSFIVLKDVKTNQKITSSNVISHFRRSSFFNNKNKGDFISTRPKYIPRNSRFNNIKGKKKIIQPMKFLEKHARNKIKKDFISPYIERLIQQNNINYKTIKNEDKPTYYNLFKVNDLCNKKNSRLNLNFEENNIFLSENEYLIKSFHMDEYRVIMRYLLGYVFNKDANNKWYDNNRYNHRRKIVYKKYMNYINNNYTLIEEENENNESPVINQQELDFFLFNDNLLKLSLYAERDKRDYPLCKSPNYYLSRDVPNKMIPNAIPNYFFNGNIIHFLIKKYAFYKKFNIEIELVQNFNENNIFDAEKNNSSYNTPSKELNFGDNVSKESIKKEVNDLNNDESSIENFIDDNINYENTHQNVLYDIKKLIKHLKYKKDDANERLKQRAKSNRPKKHITIKKKKKIKKPYEFYEIIQCDDFYINKTEKSKILKLISDEMFNLTSVKTRIKRKHTTRVYFKPDLKMNNNKALSNDKFIRKNRYFKTNANLKKDFNNDYLSFNRSRDNRMKTYKENFHIKDFNSFISQAMKNNNNDINNNKNNIKMKIFQNLVRQKKISFSIIAKNNIIKFKDTSNFLSTINNTIKDKINKRKLIKDIIINYQKENNERKTNSLNFPEINKFSVNTINSLKRKNYISLNKNKIMNYRNFDLIAKKTVYKDTLKISDIFKHKKIYLNM